MATAALPQRRASLRLASSTPTTSTSSPGRALREAGSSTSAPRTPTSVARSAPARASPRDATAPDSRSSARAAYSSPGTPSNRTGGSAKRRGIGSKPVMQERAPKLTDVRSVEDDHEDLLFMPIADELLSTRARAERQRTPSPSQSRRPSYTSRSPTSPSVLAVPVAGLGDRGSSTESLSEALPIEDRERTPSPSRSRIPSRSATMARDGSSSSSASGTSPGRRRSLALPDPSADVAFPTKGPTAGRGPRRSAGGMMAKSTPPSSSRTRSALTNGETPELVRRGSTSSTYSRTRAQTGNMLTSRRPPTATHTPVRSTSVRRPSGPRQRSHSTSSIDAPPPWVSDQPLMYRSEAISIGGAAPGSLAALADRSNEANLPEQPRSYDEVVLPTVAKALRQKQLLEQAATDDALITAYDSKGSPARIAVRRRSEGVENVPPTSETIEMRVVDLGSDPAIHGDDAGQTLVVPASTRSAPPTPLTPPPFGNWNRQELWQDVRLTEQGLTLIRQPELASPGVAKRTRSREASARGAVAAASGPPVDDKARTADVDTHKGGCRCSIM